MTTWVETKNQLGLIETSLKTLKDSKVSRSNSSTCNLHGWCRVIMLDFGHI